MSFALQVSDPTQSTVSELVAAVPQSGSFTPTFTTIQGLVAMSNISTSYRVDGGMVTVSGMVTLLTDKVVAPYQFSMTVPFPFDLTRVNSVRGASNGIPIFGTDEVFIGPVVYDLVDQRILCTVLSSNSAAAGSREIGLYFSFSYFMADPNPLAVVLDLPL
jgi:hypothetical protein